MLIEREKYDTKLKGTEGGFFESSMRLFDGGQNSEWEIIFRRRKKWNQLNYIRKIIDCNIASL